ncbi:ABC transporter ATP-binding protein [Polycladidibacter stylochi]|uniref:ABC transporter ATP-binding protein n=1 Tax=Polycladidibacter stylochi TaxID=1807766 RepID=UPI0008340D9F|nr:ABC transporter ATP-binding protein [Pseudovibrio stylochi]
MSIVQLQDMTTNIGPYRILHNVSFEVPTGGVFVLLGRNGAGKTTTLRSIMGLWQTSPKSVFFKGKDISGLHTSEIARMGVAYVPENMGIFGGLTVEENLRLATTKGKFDKSRLSWVYQLFPALEKFWHTKAAALSGGQKQMLSVARAVIEPRELILIDEPTKGLAPAIIANMHDAFAEISQTTTLILVEQNFAFARSLGNQLAVIDDGCVAYTGSMNAFESDAELQARLLGVA